MEPLASSLQQFTISLGGCVEAGRTRRRKPRASVSSCSNRNEWRHNFNVEQALEDQLDHVYEVLMASENDMAEAEETEATAEGNLDVTQRALPV